MLSECSLCEHRVSTYCRSGNFCVFRFSQICVFYVNFEYLHTVDLVIFACLDFRKFVFFFNEVLNLQIINFNDTSAHKKIYCKILKFANLRNSQNLKHRDITRSTVLTNDNSCLTNKC